MEIEIVTKADLQLFRLQLLQDLKDLIQPNEKPVELLKSSEVRKMLKISAGTLFNYRAKGLIHGSQLPNCRPWYYSADEVNRLKEYLLTHK